MASVRVCGFHKVDKPHDYTQRAVHVLYTMTHSGSRSQQQRAVTRAAWCLGLEKPRLDAARGATTLPKQDLHASPGLFTPRQASHADIEEHAKAEGERTAEAAGD